jgi:hypothetical protein
MEVAQSPTENRIKALKEENAKLKQALATLAGDGDGQPIDAATIRSWSAAEIADFGPMRALDILNRDLETSR